MKKEVSQNRWYRRWTWRQAIARCCGLALVALIVLAGLVHWRLRSSLPILDGQLLVDGIQQGVSIERDKIGVTTINAESRLDAAFGLGFVHAQDRFFQMDLLRRMSSGRLSEIFGADALKLDEKFRKHRFSATASKVLEDMSGPHRELINAYVDGVNYGLSQLGAPSFEYTLLRTSPKEWKAEDCIHVVLTMLADLQLIDAEHEISRGVLREKVPEEVFEFLTQRGSSWDAPIDDSEIASIPIPGPEIWSLRRAPSNRESTQGADAQDKSALFTPFTEQGAMSNRNMKVGSNNWAVSKQLGKDKRAILASDMHLGLSVPTIWYRAVMNTRGLDGVRRRLVGVTLPGTPAMIEGSNGFVAWGLTNSYGDFGDVVELVTVEGEPDKYVTPEGNRPIERFEEEITYPGGSKKIEYEWSIWGPVVAKQGDRRFVHHWVGDDPAACNMTIFDIETAAKCESAIELFNQAGMPHLNVVVVDHQGNIGWTLCGRIPQRNSPAPRTPVDWSTGEQWSGYLALKGYPRLVNPSGGRLWTANNRVVGGPWLEALGDGGYDLGGRAHQIRNRLLEKSEFDERDLLAIQLDDEALFLERWHTLLEKTIQTNKGSVTSEFEQFVKNWGRRASIESVGYRIVRTFRTHVENIFFAVPGKALPNAKLGAIPNQAGLKRRAPMAAEQVLWQLITEQPDHWLPPEFETWNDLFVAAAKSTEKELTSGKPLRQSTWGEANKAKIFHPLSMGLPLIHRLVRYA